MRPLFRKDPWRRRLGVITQAVGIADPIVLAILALLLAVIGGLNSVEVDEFLEWLKAIRGNSIP